MRKFLFLVLVGTLLLSGCGKPTIVELPDLDNVRIQSLYPDDTNMWENIFEASEKIEILNQPHGVIMPHHLVAAFEISGLYKGMADLITPNLVVVIGPNHYENGEADVQTCKRCVYQTTEGDLEVARSYTDGLVDDGVAKYMDETFVNEHAIFAHAPFIKKFFPDAEIVPIALKWDTSVEEISALSDWLNNNLPDDALVIASVDFSHYVPWEVADFHDWSAWDTIMNFDFNNLHDLEVDSPASLYTLMDLMQKREYMSADRYGHTNLQQFLSDHTEETTSHQFITFDDGVAGYLSGATILSVGNLPAENDFAFMDGWQWDPNYDEATDLSSYRYLRDLRGQEDRFLVGSDYLVFDLIDGACREEEQNNMRVAFCKVVEDGDLEASELLATVDKADLVYVLYEMNGGEIDKSRKASFKELADLGADIVVGRGVSGVVPFEYYKGSLLFYSLGDFVTDAKLANELTNQSEGVVLGLYVNPQSYYIYTFPVDVKNGYPSLKDFSERPGFFLNFTSAVGATAPEIDLQKGLMVVDR